MAGSIVSVLWLCAIFIVAFGHAIYLLDRRTSSQFKTIDASVLTLLLSMFGDFEFDTFDAMDFPVLAKLFFVLFLFVGALLTMNLVRLHALRCAALPLPNLCRALRFQWRADRIGWRLHLDEWYQQRHLRGGEP